MRIGRQPLALGLHSEAIQLLLVQPSVEKGARINPGRRMPLKINQITGQAGAVLFYRTAEEMIKADIIKRRRRGETGDMPSQIAGLAVGPHHHRQRIPAHQAANAVLKRVVSGRGNLVRRRDGVDIPRIRGIRQISAIAARPVNQLPDEKMGSLIPVVRDDRFQSVQPLLRLFRIRIVRIRGHFFFSYTSSLGKGLSYTKGTGKRKIHFFLARWARYSALLSAPTILPVNEAALRGGRWASSSEKRASASKAGRVGGRAMSKQRTNSPRRGNIAGFQPPGDFTNGCLDDLLMIFRQLAADEKRRLIGQNRLQIGDCGNDTVRRLKQDDTAIESAHFIEEIAAFFWRPAESP